MEIRVNGNLTDVDPAMTVADLVQRLGCERERVAIAVNKEFVPQGQYAGVRLQDGDEVECVTPRQGG